MLDLAIMYHYVRPKDWKGIVPLEPEKFEQQIEILNKSFEIVSPEELSKPVGLKPKCILTFDDGTKDQYTNAFQIMKRKGVPGYFTVMSGPLKDKVVPIFHLVHILLSFYSDEEVWNDLCSLYDLKDVPNLAKIYSYEYDAYRRNNKYALNFSLSEHESRNYLETKVIKMFGSKQKLIDQYYINRAEFIEMKNQGMTIGVHSTHHIPYHGQADDFYTNEIEPCSQYLERELGIKPVWYTPAFGGGENYKEMFKDLEPILREHGFKGGFTTIQGKNNGLSSFWLNRYDCIHVPPFKSFES